MKRAPAVSIMGHIDHGKSTLLSYIRKSNKPLNEAGGITQHISSYEIEHKNEKGQIEKITFIDTPGHEAFRSIRKRGAKVADIAILVVSAEDGVKPQTVEALKFIKESNTPFIVAITKIDKPDASIEKTKNSLVENEIYIEGYGGSIPCVEVSAKTGVGINELLDMILLVSDIEGLSGDENKLGNGFILESNKDSKNGITAVCIIKDGKIEVGDFLVSGESIATIRTMEDCDGKKIKEATFSSPVKIFGFDSIPKAGEFFHITKDKNSAISSKNKIENQEDYIDKNSKHRFPIVVKADMAGTLDAVLYEISKIGDEEISPKIIRSGIGSITEADVKIANGKDKAIVVGFSVKADNLASHFAEKEGIEIKTFDIIYKMSEWLKEELENRKPKNDVETVKGLVKVLKTFSKVKDKQVIGCKLEEGVVKVGSPIKIFRRDEEISIGKVKNLQVQKVEVDKIEDPKEFGAMVECKLEIASGDKIIIN